MNKKNINKIVLVSLCDNFSNQLGNALSQNLGMLFCDTKALVEYELVDKKAIEELCSVEYLRSCERRAIKHIASFENVVVSIDYDYLVRNFNLLKEDSLIVFVELSKTSVKENAQTINFLAYAQRTEDLKVISDHCVPLRKLDVDFAVKKIVQELRRYV